LAKEWRTDRVLRHLEALLLVADPTNTFLVSGNGDVIEPDDDVAAIGSGGAFAKAAATALMENTKLSAREIVEILGAIGGNHANRANPAPAIRLAGDPAELHWQFALFERDAGMCRAAERGDRAR